MYKEYLALNNLQWLICNKSKPSQIIYIFYPKVQRGWAVATGRA